MAPSQFASRYAWSTLPAHIQVCTVSMCSASMPASISSGLMHARQVADSAFTRLTDLMLELVVEQKLPIPRPFMRVRSVLGIGQTAPTGLQCRGRLSYASSQSSVQFIHFSLAWNLRLISVCVSVLLTMASRHRGNTAFP